MPDHFEKAKDDILARTESNGGPTPHDLLLAMQGLAQDVDDAFKESARDRSQREQRVVVLESWVKNSERECPERIKRMLDERDRDIEKRHDKKHEHHLQRDHDISVVDGKLVVDDETQEMKVSFRFGKFIIGSILVVLATVLINFAFNRAWQDDTIKANRQDLRALIELIQEEQNEPYHSSPLPTFEP